jgi:hypothetical protein
LTFSRLARRQIWLKHPMLLAGRGDGGISRSGKVLQFSVKVAQFYLI